MIYGKLIGKNNNYAIYQFGDSPSNLTGKVKILSDLSIEILQEPDHNMNLWLGKMIFTYREEFGKENFPEKISYEC